MFSSEAARLFIREQRLDTSVTLRVLTVKNVDDICNVVRKPGSKYANEMTNIGQQVLVTAQENLKVAVFLLHH